MSSTSGQAIADPNRRAVEQHQRAAPRPARCGTAAGRAVVGATEIGWTGGAVRSSRTMSDEQRRAWREEKHNRHDPFDSGAEVETSAGGLHDSLRGREGRVEG